MPVRVRAIGIVIGACLAWSACSTPQDCPRSVAEACATDYVCVTQWPSDAKAFCALPATSVSTVDCGAYHVLNASQDDGSGARYYYAIDTGELEAIVSFDTSRQIEGCQGGPSDLAVSRCAEGRIVVCPSTDAGAGGSGGAGGGGTSGAGG